MAKRPSKLVLIAAAIALAAGGTIAVMAESESSAALYGCGAFILLFVGILIGVGVAQGIAEASREPTTKKP
jgi:hypothetical protein